MVWEYRKEKDVSPKYANDTSLFTIAFYHGGKFIKEGDKIVDYVDGFKDFIDGCDPAEISMSSITCMGMLLGWIEVKNIFFKKVGAIFYTDLVEIKDDEGVIALAQFLDENRVVEVYCECGEDDSDSNSDGERIDMFKGSDVEGGEDDGIADIEIGYQPNIMDSEADPSRVTKSRVRPTVDNNGEDLMNEGGLNSDDELNSNQAEPEDDTVEVHFSKADLANVSFKIGMKFATVDDFKTAIKLYSFQNGKDIKFSRSSSKKMICFCNNSKDRGHDCTWYLYCSTSPKATDPYTMQIKTFIDQHTCGRTQDLSACKPKFLAKHYEEQIRNNPKWAVKAFRDHAARDLQCKVKLPKIYKALSLAKKSIQGSITDQYMCLYDYCEELRRTNVGSTVELNISEKRGPGGEGIFESLYICWGALKKGFVKGCRPIIGLDGCHLSGPYRGVLLSAVGIDPNNCMYPFAYAIVDNEKYETWKWFILHIMTDVNIQRAEDYTIISDKQKGLIKAVDELLPGIEHRFCARHLYNNFAQTHKGEALKLLFEKAARATTMAHFESALQEMKVLDEDAYNWLAARPDDKWSRAHFSTHTKCAMLLNNLCESFNASIKEFRVLPILNMLEELRVYLMELVMRKKEGMRKCTDKGLVLCPKVRRKLDIHKLYCHDWICYFNGEDGFELAAPTGERVRCSLEDKSCGCNSWQLTGIPCVHAIAAMYHQSKEPEDYVHKCYSIETYNLVYSNVMNPINGKELWPKTGGPKLLPPPMPDVKLGRPPKVRRRGPNEPNKSKLSKVGVVMRCTKCHQAGHNSRTCGKSKEPRSQGKGIRKKRKTKRSMGLIDETDVEVQGEGVSDNVQGESDQVEGESEQVQGESEPIEGESQQVQGESEQVDGGKEQYQVDSEELWATFGHLVQGMGSQPVTSTFSNEVCQSPLRAVSSQPNSTKATTRKKYANVRRSERIANSPKKGPIIVDFLDLTDKASDTIHAGILRAPEPPSKLPKEHIRKGNKVFLTPGALLAEVEHNKKARN